MKNFYESKDFNWEGIDKVEYKNANISGPMTFNATDRQTLVGDGQNTAFHARYFECDKGGYSSLEKHEHVHVVIVGRGEGQIIIEDEVHDVKPMDLVVIPSWAKHQLVNVGDEPFGFFCMVDADRDRFQTLTKEEIDDMCKNEKVKKALKINEKYFG